MKGRTSTENIFCKIIIVMNTYNLNLGSMVGFTSEGTAAMIGQNGVAEKLKIRVKEENRQINFWTLHCTDMKWIFFIYDRINSILLKSITGVFNSFTTFLISISNICKSRWRNSRFSSINFARCGKCQKSRVSRLF